MMVPRWIFIGFTGGVGVHVPRVSRVGRVVEKQSDEFGLAETVCVW